LLLNHASDAYRIAVQAKEAEDGESSKDHRKSQDTGARPDEASGKGAITIEGRKEARTAKGAKSRRYGHGEESRDDDRRGLRGDAGDGP
jgi:hypothetical protein